MIEAVLRDSFAGIGKPEPLKTMAPGASRYETSRKSTL
jgi:Txe/YoeB family toxin of Txe-Axe toxin-antitoxin module